jgi:hypothetical protein
MGGGFARFAWLLFVKAPLSEMEGGAFLLWAFPPLKGVGGMCFKRC